MTVKEFFSGALSKVDPDKAVGLMNQMRGVKATAMFDITGKDAGTWTLKLEDGMFDLIEGAVDDPTVTVSAEADDWIEIVEGRLNPQMAFMSGKLKLKGDMTIAMKLPNILSVFRSE